MIGFTYWLKEKLLVLSFSFQSFYNRKSFQEMQAINTQQNNESQTRHRLTLSSGGDESKYDKACEIEVLEIVNNCSHFEKEECRICLDGDQQQLLIQSCLCKGSVRFVHKTCLALWIDKKLEKVSSNIHCELCHKLFNYSLQVIQTLQWEQFLCQWRRKRNIIILNFVFITVLLVSFLWFNAAVFGAQNQIKRRIMSTQRIYLITIFFMIIWGLLTIVLLYSFIKIYFTKKIKKAKIEDQILYRVIIVKKKLSVLAKI